LAALRQNDLSVHKSSQTCGDIGAALSQIGEVKVFPASFG